MLAEAAAAADRAQLPQPSSPPGDEAAGFAAGLPADLLLLRVFALLPADARARCGSVCRAWAHALLRGPDAWRAWTALDLSDGSGVTCARTDAALVGAAALARGRLQTLELRCDDATARRHHLFTRASLLRVLRAAPELRSLSLGVLDGEPHVGPWALEEVAAAAGPALARLTAPSVYCAVADAHRLLRGEAPYGAALRIVRLQAEGFMHDDSADDVRRFAAAVAQHAGLAELSMRDVRFEDAGAVAALVDAAIAARLRSVELHRCSGLTAGAVCALARLVAAPGGALRELIVAHSLPPSLQGAAADEWGAARALLCGALRGNAALTHVAFFRVGLPREEAEELRAALQAALDGRAAPCELFVGN